MSRLVPAILSLRFHRKPYGWETRLTEALIFGELVVARKPVDAGLAEIHDVAEAVVEVITTTARN